MPGRSRVDCFADGAIAVIRVCGTLDSLSAAEVRSAIGRVASRRSILDLEDVDFIDSAGLGAIIGGVRRVREAGGVVVVRCRPGYVLQLLIDIGIDRLVALSMGGGAGAAASAAT